VSFLSPQAYYFDRDDIALPGFFKYFKHASDEEREHAEKLMKYQNKRGGKIILKDIIKPSKDEWGCAVEAMEAALQLEKDVNEVNNTYYITVSVLYTLYICIALQYF
jgi:ferritin heavy chain